MPNFELLFIDSTLPNEIFKLFIVQPDTIIVDSFHLELTNYRPLCLYHGNISFIDSIYKMSIIEFECITCTSQRIQKELLVCLYIISN